LQIKINRKNYLAGGLLEDIACCKKTIKGNIDKLNKKFGENRPISSTCGIILEYLGMTLDKSQYMISK